jgi:molybdopterin-guanine dinucleotide biosynthesis protein B
MPPIIFIVGKSNSGKTTIVERLIVEFKRRGYRVATIKHEAYGFDIDKPGKDSWRHAQAGSDAVVLSSSQKLALIKNIDHEPSTAELARLIGTDFDIIIVEGFKQGKGLKIEVHRKELGELVCDPRELTAIVTDEPLALDVPQFHPDDASALAELIEKRLPASKEETTVFINGKPVPLSPFPQEFISKTLLGMVSALKGIEEPQSIDISVTRKPK